MCVCRPIKFSCVIPFTGVDVTLVMASFETPSSQTDTSSDGASQLQPSQEVLLDRNSQPNGGIFSSNRSQARCSEGTDQDLTQGASELRPTKRRHIEVDEDRHVDSSSGAHSSRLRRIICDDSDDDFDA